MEMTATLWLSPHDAGRQVESEGEGARAAIQKLLLLMFSPPSERVAQTEDSYKKRWKRP